MRATIRIKTTDNFEPRSIFEQMFDCHITRK